MAVTVSNLTQGPGTLYTGAFDADEPLDSAVNATPAASAWTDLGGTMDGSKLIIKQEYKALEVDQIVDNPGSRLIKRETKIETNMAEPTLENLALALNDGTISTGSGWEAYEPDATDSATQPTYTALILHGWIGTARRMVILRKVLSVEGVEPEYKKDGQSVLKVTFEAHYVSASVRPFRIIDEVPA
jgi:hypothetical protein